jgi:hypothetical protein
MPRKVDGNEGTVEGEGHGVPRVRILGAAMEQHDLGRARAPHERADGAGRGLDVDASNGGVAAPRNAELLGVLVKQAELVVAGRTVHDP